MPQAKGDLVALGRLAAVFEPGDPPRCGVVFFWNPEGTAIPDALTGLGEPAEIAVATPVAGRIELRRVPALRVPIGTAVRLLAVAGKAGTQHPAARFWSAMTVAGLHLTARGRILPGVSAQGFDAWRAGPLEVPDVARIRSLAAAMPPAARAIPLEPGASPLLLPDPQRLVRAFLDAVADTMPRTAAAPWLAGDSRFTAAQPVPSGDLRAWAQEVSTGVDSGLQVGLRLEVRGELGATPFTAVVRLRDLADPTLVTEAAALWEGDDHGFGERATFEAMLAVRRAARVWEPLEQLLRQAKPVELELLDEDVLELLGGAAARLAAAGIDLEWPAGLSRELGVRALVSSPAEWPENVAGALRGGAPMPLCWQLTFSGEPLTDTEMDLVAKSGPVLALRSQWVLVGPELARKARERALEPLRPYDALAATLIGTAEVENSRVEVVAEGWLSMLAGRIADPDGGAEALAQPAALTATLRDYQLRGLRWLDRMAELGLGGCLADDMGLGKTVMLIALHLRRQQRPAERGPTLVVCPASVLGNWQREISRFAPGTPVRRFHGSSRSLAGLREGFVLTTYATMRIDVVALASQRWGLLVADEAQQVKNRLSDAARALRQIPAAVRVALTGTPVENNLSELWAILDWTTPGLLDRIGVFRAQWARPIEAERDNAALERLARLMRPFLLRRKKSDPGIVAELPPKTETDHLVRLTSEQADLYRRVVREMMGQIRTSPTTIARRGLVLKLLTGLKQVCNHPAHYLKEPQPALPGRAQKLSVLEELVDTIIAEDGAVLVFTQYVQMARLLERHLTRRGVPNQLLHGGTPVPAREEMVRRFQDGQVPVFLLSLKAAGTGLTLTRADHVIHYDRWWNPAVEEQATDRTHRIGQTKPVQVHRLIVEGTLEERIATLLESKRELADAVLGRGEAALSELSDAGLQRLVELRIME